MSYKQGRDRYQYQLQAECLDDYVSKDNMCRVIDLFIEKTDLAELGFKYAKPSETGRPPYSPWAMSKLYVYGYQNYTRSSRRLETETKRNIEVMWLMEGLTPDDKTISNFRKDNAKALKALYIKFVDFCKTCELIGKKTASTDGTKIKANNSRNNVYTEKKASEELEKLKSKIDEYLEMLDKNDEQEQKEPKVSKEDIRKALEKLKNKETKLMDVLEKIEETGQTHVCTTDEEAKLMKQSGGKGYVAGYNVQTVIDEAHGLIINYEVMDQANDLNALSVMCEKAEEVYETTDFQMLADMGYCSGEDLKKCSDMGVACLVPKPEPSHQPKDSAYHREQFVYDSNNNEYICPAGHIMPQVRTRKRDGYAVYANRGACKNCEEKSNCTKSKTLREIERSPHQEYIDQAAMRVKENKALYQRRFPLSESPFGVIKSIWGFDHYLCRGNDKVSAETALSFLAFNFKRVASILGVKSMMEALA